MYLLSRLRGAAFALLLVTTALVGSTLLLPPAILLPLGFKSIYTKYASFIAWWWFSCAAAAIEVIGGVRYEIAGDVPDDEKVLVICNHHCRLDWLYLWPLVMRHGRCGALHVTLKDSLRSAPFFGWAMQSFGFAFVSRKDREGDLDVIKSSLADRKPLWALLFPEGTDLSDSNVKKSQAHGATLTPPIKWSHVLVPRAAGFAAAVEAMGSPVIYDLTIAYDNDRRPDEPSMLAGRFPRRVVVRVDRFDKTPRDAKKWLFERWALKEERLAAGLTGEPSASSNALVHVLCGAFIAALACYALCVDWRVRRAFYGSAALWVGCSEIGGLEECFPSGS
jgi:lysocardiolipin and lysophospholipid acyltransferase